MRSEAHLSKHTLKIKQQNLTTHLTCKIQTQVEVSQVGAKLKDCERRHAGCAPQLACLRHPENAYTQTHKIQG